MDTGSDLYLKGESVMNNVFELLKFSNYNRLSIILQTEVAECGLACLGMVASAYGHKIDLNTLRRQYPTSLRGSTLQNLIQIADKMHFSSRPLRLELEEMNQLQLPAILHWDLNHFVVLKKVNAKNIVIHDPAQGVRKIPMEEVSKHFTGVALELSPSSNFKPKDEVRKLPLSAFWSRIIGLKQIILNVFLLSVVLQVFSLMSPYYMQLVVDEVLMRFDSSLLTVLAIGFAMLMLINVATETLRSYVVLKCSSLLSIQMAANLFRHLVRLPLSFFEKRHIGDIVSRFGSLSKIENFFTQGMVQALVDGIMSIATLVLMFIYGPQLMFIVLGAVTIYGVIRFAYYYPLRAINEETIISKAKESSNFMETIRGIQSVKIFGKESQRQVLWQNRFADSMNAGIRQSKMGIGFSVLNSVLFGLENILVVYFGAKMVMSGGFSVGMLYAFMSYKSQFVSRIVGLINNLIEVKMLGLHLERLGDIVLEEEEPQEYFSLENEHQVEGTIRLENVSFQYNAEENAIFKNINLTIQAGESIAIIGPSGCGKTTLMKVMMGLFQPTSGTVYIDGVPLPKIGNKKYRENFGAVMQNDQLLSGSINENICFFEPLVDDKRIQEAAMMSVIHQDVAKMPMGYNTLIGDMGTSLSGGQKQRVLLARALYKNPKFLYLDEATSHLDIALEQAVNYAIKQLKMTRIIIAHRPETIRSADRIFVLTPEGIVEQTKEMHVSAQPA